MKSFDRLYIQLFLLLDAILIVSVALVVGQLRSAHDASVSDLASRNKGTAVALVFSPSPSPARLSDVVPTYTPQPTATPTQPPVAPLTELDVPSATAALTALSVGNPAPYDTPVPKSDPGSMIVPTVAHVQDLGILPSLTPPVYAGIAGQGGLLFDPSAPTAVPADAAGFPIQVYVSTAPDCVPQGLPVQGILTQYFSWYHPAIDLAVPTGTTVLATHSGEVIYAGWRTDGYGLLVILQNGRFITYYAHNSSLLVAAGQIVKAGDPLSLSGTTGHSSGPHVHYEIHVDNVPVNPFAFYPQRYFGC